MKHGKKPTLKQKELIESKKLDSEHWLVVKDTTKILEIVNRSSGKTRTFDK